MGRGALERDNQQRTFAHTHKRKPLNNFTVVPYPLRLSTTRARLRSRQMKMSARALFRLRCSCNTFLFQRVTSSMFCACSRT